MKIIKKIGAIFIGLITCIQIFFYKVYADYRFEVGPVYGIEEPPKSVNLIMDILGKLRIIFIPIILLIGIIVYFKKSKSSKKKKMLITIGIVSLTVIIYFVINEIFFC